MECSEDVGNQLADTDARGTLAGRSYFTGRFPGAAHPQ